MADEEWVDPETEDMEEDSTDYIEAIDSTAPDDSDELPSDEDEDDEDTIIDAGADDTIPDEEDDAGDASGTAEDVEPIDEEEPDDDDELPTDPDEADESEDLDETLPADDADEPTDINDNQATLPCICSVKQGDTVMVAMRNGEPTIIGRAGWGDGVDEATAAAQASADDAAEAAAAAQSSADNAATAAAAAQTSANAAATAASAAQSTANSAASAASAAQTSADAAATAASNAQDSADAASDALQSVVSGATTVEKAVSVMQTALEAIVDYDAGNDTTTEYFWHDANGAHVLGDTSGYRNDTDSTGMSIVDTSDEESVAEFGADGAQIGKASAGNYIAIDSDSFDLFHSNMEMVHFGYGEGNAESGTAIAPYYTIGTRASGSAVGNYSVAEGRSTTASGYTSHSEGAGTTAGGNRSHAEGGYTTASGEDSHAEGGYTTASGGASHAEGENTTASGYYSHAEGFTTTASGDTSHAEGSRTTASGNRSHAQNLGTIARSEAQTALGKYNVEDTNDAYAVIVGNGTSDNARSNALTVDWDGDVETAGDVTIRTSNIDRDGTLPSTSQFSNVRFRIADVDNEAVTYYDGYRLTTGETGARLVAFAEDANGDAIFNTFRVGKLADGTNVYYVTDPAAFREAINAVGTSDQASQNAALINLSTATQHWALRSNVINSNNTTYHGHTTGLGMTNTNAFFYDFTGQNIIWSAYTTKSPQPAEAWDVYKSTTVSQVITAGSGRTVSSVTYAEWGKVAMLSVSISGWAASTGSQTGGTVVSGKRPVYDVYATDVSSSYAVYAQLNQSGTLTVYWGTAPSTSTAYTIRFIYILA